MVNIKPIICPYITQTLSDINPNSITRYLRNLRSQLKENIPHNVSGELRRKIIKFINHMSSAVFLSNRDGRRLTLCSESGYESYFDVDDSETVRLATSLFSNLLSNHDYELLLDQREEEREREEEEFEEEFGIELFIRDMRNRLNDSQDLDFQEQIPILQGLINEIDVKKQELSDMIVHLLDIEQNIHIRMYIQYQIAELGYMIQRIRNRIDIIVSALNEINDIQLNEFLITNVMGEHECPVCMEDKENCVYINCGNNHILCRDCLLNWKRSPNDNNTKCPLCRGPSNGPAFFGRRDRRSKKRRNRRSKKRRNRRSHKKIYLKFSRILSLKIKDFFQKKNKIKNEL
jgi:hypothetical protein